MIKRVKDYCSIIHEKFPTISESDIKKILDFGFKSLYLHNLYGGDVFIRDRDLWMYIGKMSYNGIKNYRRYRNKLALKIRVLSKRDKIPWDGYYYFALTDNQQKLVEEQNHKKGRKKKHLVYGNVVLYRLRNECEVKNSNKKYIYRVPILYADKYAIYRENYETDKAELILTRKPLTFNDLINKNMTWRTK